MCQKKIILKPDGLFLRYNQSSSTVIPGGKPDFSDFLPAVVMFGSENECFERKCSLKKIFFINWHSLWYRDK